jgi:predicted permease
VSPFWRRRRREAELDEEIESHLALAARDHEARGESPTEAAYGARREFGNGTLVKEITRGMWRGAWLADLGQELRFALRSIRRSPAFALSVVLVLGLGIGAAAAMYGILDRLLLRAPEQVRDPDGLFAPSIRFVDYRGVEGASGQMQWQEYRALADGMSAMATSCAFEGPDQSEISVGDAPIQAQVVLASATYFDVLGARPFLGRFFVPGDSGPLAPPVAVISYGFWKQVFGGSSGAVGGTLASGRVTYTIVGVTPRGFSGTTPHRVDVWLPAERAAPAAFGPEWRESGFFWYMVARLRPGRSARQAVAAGHIRLRAEPPSTRYVRGPITGVEAGSIIPGRTRVTLTRGMQLSYVVGGAAALVGLIALANATGLLLLRGLRRRRETAVRLALGVSRGRLMRAIAVESAVLALLAGLAACLAASLGGELLRRLLLRVDWAVPVLDLRVGLLTVAAALGLGCVAGLLPGWLAARPQTVAALKIGLHESGSRSPARGALLIAQATLAVALLAGLSLYVRSFARARAYDFGLDVDHVLVALLQEPRDYPPPVPEELSGAVVSRIQALSGVQAVALANSIPLWSYVGNPIRAEGLDSFPRSLMLEGPYMVESSPSYFALTGLALLRGRYYVDQGPGGPREAVVSARMAQVIAPRGDAIGRCLYIGPGATDCHRIVGVVGDMRGSLSQPKPLLTYYIPLSQGPQQQGAKALLVRAANPNRLVPAVRQIIATLTGVKGPQAVRTLSDIVDPEYRRLRQGMALFGIFAGLAVVVAMIGMYSVVAYSVAQRTHEFGIRVALGARPWNVIRLVLDQALLYAGVGLVLGLVLALAGARYIGPLLFETSPRDPLALAAAALALVAAALIACIVPARSAARADPRQALQAE